MSLSAPALANTTYSQEQAATDHTVLEYFYGVFLSLYDVFDPSSAFAGGASPLRRYRSGVAGPIRAYPQCGALPRNAPVNPIKAARIDRRAIARPAARMRQHRDAHTQNITLPGHFYDLLMANYTLDKMPSQNHKPLSPQTLRLVQTAADAAADSLVIANACGTRQERYPGLPKNTRQVAEGYWLGSYPNLNGLKALQEHNIRLVITATRAPVTRDFNMRIDELGIAHLIIPFGGRFPNPDSFYPQILKFAPEEIFIHCDHGGDRSGTMLAYLLATRHNWPPQKALLAMLYPAKSDLLGLLAVLEERDIETTPDDIIRYLGIYSAERNGGFGGLKAHAPGYKKLIRSMLDTLDKQQAAKYAPVQP